jgi:hypothetical protein
MIREETNEEDPKALALSALTWVLSNEERAERFIALTGLTADDIRARINSVELLDAVLAYLEGNQADLVACASTIDVPPMVLSEARGKLR